MFGRISCAFVVEKIFSPLLLGKRVVGNRKLRLTTFDRRAEIVYFPDICQRQFGRHTYRRSGLNESQKFREIFCLRLDSDLWAVLHCRKIFSALNMAKIVRAEFQIFAGESFQQVTDAATNENHLVTKSSVLQRSQNIFLRGEMNILAQARTNRFFLQRLQLFNQLININRIVADAQIGNINLLEVIEYLFEFFNSRRAVGSNKIRSENILAQVDANFFRGIGDTQIFHADNSFKISKPTSKFLSGNLSKSFFASSVGIFMTSSITLS